MWFSQDTKWQEDPFLVTQPGEVRHVMNTIWCIAADFGTPTFDSSGEPEHSIVALKFIDPSFVVRRAGFSLDVTRSAIERLREPIPATDFAPEIPAPIEVYAGSGTALIRDVGRMQSKLLKDRWRKTGKPKELQLSAERSLFSAETSPPSAETSAFSARQTDRQDRQTNSTTKRAPESPRKGPPAGEYPDAFESFWKAYPRREGKPAAFGRWSKLLEQGASETDLEAAARHYAVHMGRVARDPEHIKHASTFLSEKDQWWKEYVEGPPEHAGPSRRTTAPPPVNLNTRIKPGEKL